MQVIRWLVFYVVQPIGSVVIGFKVGAATVDFTFATGLLIAVLALALWIGSVNLFCSKVLR